MDEGVSVHAKLTPTTRSSKLPEVEHHNGSMGLTGGNVLWLKS